MPTDPTADRKIITPDFGSFRRKLVDKGSLAPLDKKRLYGKAKAPQYHVSDKPNVLWIMADQLRADTFGFMNHPFIKTPNIDRLAARSAVCTRSYCSSPVCMPSRATFLTGKYLPQHDVIQNGYRMNETETVFPTLVARAGYRTANIGKNHAGRAPDRVWEYDECIEDAFGATKPSRVSFDAGNYPEIEFIGGKVCDHSDYVLWGKYPGPEKTSKSYQLASSAIKWLYWNDDPRPFFLRVSFDDPHPPVVPPDPYFGMYDPDVIDAQFFKGATEHFDKKPRVPREWREYHGDTQISEEGHRRHFAEYCALVTHLDAQIGRILDYLEETPWADNTIVVLNADHGHMIGDLGFVHKGAMLYEGTTHIPTLFSWPGTIKTAMCESLVDGTDFVPTMLELLGIDSPEDLPGVSLVPQLKGEKHKDREYVFCQWDDYGYGIFGKRYKLMWWTPYGEGEMYDLEEDPGEVHNIFDDTSTRELRDEMIGELTAWSGIQVKL